MSLKEGRRERIASGDSAKEARRGRPASGESPALNSRPSGAFIMLVKEGRRGRIAVGESPARSEPQGVDGRRPTAKDCVADGRRDSVADGRRDSAGDLPALGEEEPGRRNEKRIIEGFAAWSGDRADDTGAVRSA